MRTSSTEPTSSRRYRMEALVNVLLWERPKRGLLFCHTRLETMSVAQRLGEEVQGGSLHGEMTQRKETPCSLLQNGRALLMATNVAARGSTWKGHSCHPAWASRRQNTFVHRSGRTGRAGHEGVNVLLLSPQESAKFKYMLGTAKVSVEWHNVPNNEAIGKIQREITEEKLLTLTAPEHRESYIAWAEDLLTRVSPKELVARLLWGLSSKRSTVQPHRGLDREIRRKSRRSLDSAGPGTKGRRPGYHASPREGAEGWMGCRPGAGRCLYLPLVDRSEVGPYG